MTSMQCAAAAPVAAEDEDAGGNELANRHRQDGNGVQDRVQASAAAGLDRVRQDRVHDLQNRRGSCSTTAVR